jgi:hypothetical protein
MRIALAFGVLAAFTACKTAGSDNSAITPAPTGAAGSDVPTLAAEPSSCSLAGDYRLRFASNGADWWWRLKVTEAGTDLSGELVAPIPVLGIETAGPVDVRRAPTVVQ